MKAVFPFFAALLLIVAAIATTSCDKERVVTNTEVVHETKYLEQPPDTVRIVDTVHASDTVSHVDTVKVNVTIHDTVKINVAVHDTIIKTVNHYDTVHVVDTVKVTSTAPNAALAVAAMESQTDPMVFKFVSDSLGVSGGWTFYLSQEQMYISQVSSKVWDIDAYVDYWTDDFSGYYPLEVSWRLTYVSGDPTNAANWTLGDPPAAVSGHPAGVSASASMSAKLQSVVQARTASRLK